MDRLNEELIATFGTSNNTELAKGVNSQSRDPISGWTPLHYYAKYNRHFLAEEFLNQGGDLNACDFDGNTALHLCAVHDCIECASVLLKFDADVYLKEKLFGQTALDLAKQNGHTRIISVIENHNLCNGDELFNDASPLCDYCQKPQMSLCECSSQILPRANETRIQLLEEKVCVLGRENAELRSRLVAVGNHSGVRGSGVCMGAGKPSKFSFMND